MKQRFSISAAPDPDHGFFLNQTSDENSDKEAQCINFDTLTDDEKFLIPMLHVLPVPL